MAGSEREALRNPRGERLPDRQRTFEPPYATVALRDSRRADLLGVIAATPLVLGGRVYVQTLRSNVYALDERSGRIVRVHRFDREDGGPNRLASGAGRIYGSTDTAVFALDLASGRLDWSRRITGPHEPIDIAPATAFGLVRGTDGALPGGKGTLLALSAPNGRGALAPLTIAAAGPIRARLGGRRLVDTDAQRQERPLVGTANPLPWGGTPAANGAA